MLAGILRFELGRHLRAVSTWIYFLLFGTLGCLMMMAAAGAFEEASVNFGGGGKVMANAPYPVSVSISLLSYFGLLVIAAVAGRSACQDFDARTESFFFSAPISKTDYLGGRFLAAVAALAIILSSIGIGMLAGSLMPGLDRERLGPTHLAAYAMPYLTIVLPNLAIMAVLFFSLAALTRRIFPVYMASVLLLTGYLLAGTISRKIEHKFLASMVDPFGGSAFGYLTEYWTIAEKNHRLAGLAGYLLWNRLLWLAIAAAVAGFAWWRFRMRISGGRFADLAAEPGVPAAKAAPRVVPCPAPVRAALRLTRLHFVETVKNIYFTVMVLAGILFMVVAARSLGDMYGTATYPVTYQMIEQAGGAFGLFMLIIITFYSGELIWRERDAGVAEMTDALPVPGWVYLASKMAALFLIVAALQCVVILTAMAIQLGKGYTHLEPLLYVKTLLGLSLVEYWLTAVLAVTIHVLVNHKYLGHFVMVLYYLSETFLGRFGLEQHIYNYGSNPDYTYSDMNGFGPYLKPIFWFNLYWAACAVLLGVLVHLFWARGLAGGWADRRRVARQRLGTAPAAVAGGALALFAGVGAFLFYNTHVLHHYRNTFTTQSLTARYEREYKSVAKLPQPKITAVQVRFDLDPARGAVRFYGSYAIRNKSGRPIEKLLLGVPEDWVIHRMAFTPPAVFESEDRRLNVQVYRMRQPFAAGAEGTLDFDLEFVPHGFGNGGPSMVVAENGTFLESPLPGFGYDPDSELGDDDVRRKHKLPPKERKPDINDAAARMFSDLSRDADWVTLDTTVSTVADQIAIAPGELVREWREGNRRLFQYRTRGKAQNFLSVLSARYSVVRDRWQDVDIGIYYQRGHEYDLAQMRKGVKAALEYATANFSPYQNKTVRIVEFPRYETFAQSFLASIPYSEGIGFIARVDPSNEEDIDYPFYITAHEIGHQWWGHQAISANVQGAEVVIESLAQYTALMVMKHEFGPEQMKRFLKYEMDRYLTGRSNEKKKEMPLVRAEGQPYIHYQKGSVVFYALQDYIGEENVNRALREFLRRVAYQEPPYTTALELEAQLRAVTPPQYLYLIDDMFDSITLYENRALTATYREIAKGRYEVKLKVAARKVKADQLGEEKEAPLADWIDIGVLDGKGKPLYLARHKIVKAETEFTLVVDGVPAKAGIDPWNKLVDRQPDDNVVTVTKL